MSEFIEAIGAAASIEGAAVAGGGYAIARVLGPSVSAVGKALGDFTDYRLRNLLRLDEKIARRIQHEPQGTEEGGPEETVHPRVAKAVLDEGSWIDDDLHQEYLAGLLVGARSKDGASDEQSYMARIVTQMTADQVRLHYAMISAYAGYWDGQGDCPFPFHKRDEYRKHAVRVPVDEAVSLFPQFDTTARGLLREGLVADFGRPRVGSDLDPVHTSLVPTPLAFDVYLHALARPGRLSTKGLLLPRQTLAAAAMMHPQDNLRLHHPDPEPAKFAGAVIQTL